MSPSRTRVLLVALCLGLGHGVALAQTWSAFGQISPTLGNNQGRLCVGDLNADFGCPTYAPYITSTSLVGIGTTTPSKALNIVNGGLAITGSNSVDGSQYAARLAVDSGASYGHTLMQLQNSHGTTFFVGNDRVGVSTSSPQTTFQVNGSIRMGYESSSTLNTCDTNRLGAIKYQSNAFYVCQNASNGWEVLGTTGVNANNDRIISGTTQAIAYTNTSLSLVTAGTERVVIGTNGGVGIGQQPVNGYALSISGSLQLGITAQGNSIYIGEGAGQNSSNATSYTTAIGYLAAGNSTGHSGLMLGRTAGQANSGNGATLLGNYAGMYNAGSYVAGVGTAALQYNSSSYVVALGSAAGQYNSGTYAGFVGYAAGERNTATYLTALGAYSGQYNAGATTAAVGAFAAQYNSGTFVTAMGYSAAQYNPANSLVAVGTSAGRYNAGASTVLVGVNAGQYNSGTSLVAVGYAAGQYNSSTLSTLVGTDAGYWNSGDNVAALGRASMQYNSGAHSVAVGSTAARYNTANYVTAVGSQAVNGVSNTYSNVTGLGYNAQPTASNQIKLGDNNITSVSTSGVYYGAGVSVSGVVSASLLKLAEAPADPCNTANVGAIKVINGAIYVCRQ